MINLPMDVRTSVICAGLLYVVMPAMVWLVLAGRRNGRDLLLWCGGSAMLGVCYLLFGMRGFISDSWSIGVANVLSYGSYALRIAALRWQAGHRTSWLHALGWVLGALILLALANIHSESARTMLNIVLVMVAAVWMAHLAWQISVSMAGGRSARLIAWAYGSLAFALALRLGTRILGTGPVDVTEAPSADFLVLLLVSFVAAVFGNIGYVGMAFETSRADELAQARQLAREQAQRLLAEQQARDLRDRLAERDEFVRVLAHEVRQPLNNASAALQSAQAALSSGEDPTGARQSNVADRVGRALTVIGQIGASLDNTLAATALLASPDRISLRDSDVTALIDLALGDLDTALRPRVHVERYSATRTALMDAGLMRLALRNLLANALAYSPKGSRVTLRVSDSDEPLALMFEVIDLGDGIDVEVLPRLFERGIRGRHDQPGHGIGLYVVKRVMELHGGRVDVGTHPGGGTNFQLTLPQDVG